MKPGKLTEADVEQLRARARDLARPKRASHELDLGRSAISVIAGGERYLLPLKDVAAVAPVETIARVPFSPPYVLGVVEAHGDLQVLVDLGRLLGASGVTEARFHATLRCGDASCAFAVEQVEHIVQLPPGALLPPPAHLRPELGPTFLGTDAEGRAMLDGPALLALAGARGSLTKTPTGGAI